MTWARMFNPIRVAVPYPELEMERADDDVVAVPSIVVVEKYKFPPAFLNVHWARPPPADSES